MGGRGQPSGFFTVRRTLGRKGKAHSIDESLTVNPHFGEGEEWRTNCQRCVYAYEMQRRGYDVEALPKIMNGVDDPAKNWRHIMDGQTWERMPQRNTIVKILDTMYKWGDGARAVVYVAWKDHKSAHVFIAEQQGIGTIFADPQTGQYVDINSYMDYAIKGKTEISRIDNLKPSDSIKDYVKRRK